MTRMPTQLLYPQDNRPVQGKLVTPPGWAVHAPNFLWSHVFSDRALPNAVPPVPRLDEFLGDRGLQQAPMSELKAAQASLRNCGYGPGALKHEAHTLSGHNSAYCPTISAPIASAPNAPCSAESSVLPSNLARLIQTSDYALTTSGRGSSRT